MPRHGNFSAMTSYFLNIERKMLDHCRTFPILHHQSLRHAYFIHDVFSKTPLLTSPVRRAPFYSQSPRRNHLHRVNHHIASTNNALQWRRPMDANGGCAGDLKNIPQPDQIKDRSGMSRNFQTGRKIGAFHRLMLSGDFVCMCWREWLNTRQNRASRRFTPTPNVYGKGERRSCKTVSTVNHRLIWPFAMRRASADFEPWLLSGPTLVIFPNKLMTRRSLVQNVFCAQSSPVINMHVCSANSGFRILITTSLLAHSVGYFLSSNCLFWFSWKLSKVFIILFLQIFFNTHFASGLRKAVMGLIEVCSVCYEGWHWGVRNF